MSDTKRQRLSTSYTSSMIHSKTTSTGNSNHNESTTSEEVMKQNDTSSFATDDQVNLFEDNDDDVVVVKEERDYIDTTSNVASATSTNTDMEQKLKNERTEKTKAVHEKLQNILTDVKETTNKLLSEVDVYLKTVDSVTIDYTKCKDSQVHEATRLEEVEPDVSGATGQFLGFLQQGNANALLGNMLR